MDTLTKNIQPLDVVGKTNEIVTYPTNDGFLPSGTIITVKTDGTGNFTDLQSAVSFLNGKWSNGSVTIKIGEGTFNISKQINVVGTAFNIPQLKIEGSGMNKTILSTTDRAIVFLSCYNKVQFCNCKISAPTKSSSSGFYVDHSVNVYFNNIAIDNFYMGIYLGWLAKSSLNNALTITNCDIGIYLENHADLMVIAGSDITMSNVGTGYKLIRMSYVTSINATHTFTNVTSKSNITKNTFVTNGVLFVEGTF